MIHLQYMKSNDNTVCTCSHFLLYQSYDYFPGSSLTESSGSGSGLGSGGKAVTKLSAQQPSIELMVRHLLNVQEITLTVNS